MGHRFTLHPFDAALNLAGLTLRPVGDIVAQLVMGRIFHMEGPEHRGLCAHVWFFIVHDHRRHGQAQHIGQQNELLRLCVGDLTGAGQELDALEPGPRVLASRSITDSVMWFALRGVMTRCFFVKWCRSKAVTGRTDKAGPPSDCHYDDLSALAVAPQCRVAKLGLNAELRAWADQLGPGVTQN